MLSKCHRKLECPLRHWSAHAPDSTAPQLTNLPGEKGSHVVVPHAGDTVWDGLVFCAVLSGVRSGCGESGDFRETDSPVLFGSESQLYPFLAG